MSANERLIGNACHLLVSSQKEILARLPDGGGWGERHRTIRYAAKFIMSDAAKDKKTRRKVSKQIKSWIAYYRKFRPTEKGGAL